MSPSRGSNLEIRKQLTLESLSTCIARIHQNLSNLAALEMSKLSWLPQSRQYPWCVPR
jgi:hypothetical protein